VYGTVLEMLNPKMFTSKQD